MKTLEENLAQYAAYHRDRRNIATHFAGVPMIVFAIILALATMSITAGSMAITVAAIVSIAMCIYYFRLDLTFGLAMAVALFVMCAVASEMTARMSTVAVLCWAIAIFAAGWALQFLGHKFEGMKPAFFDDAKQLLIGPVFVCAEACILLGAKPQLKRYIEDRVGPTVARRDARSLPGRDPLPGPYPLRDPLPREREKSRERERFHSFREFYPFYLSEHRNATCRKLHFAGSTVVLGLLALALGTQALWPLGLAPVAGYGFAWVGHFAFEKNRPATFKYPGYSFLGDWVMYWQLLTGKISFEERDPRAGEGTDSA